MSLIKQIWLTILVLLLLALGGSLFIGTMNSKQYIEQELRIKNADNANALALSLSQLDKDPVTVELLVAAQFDTGHYRRIELVSPEGEVLERRVSDAPASDAPGWFVELIDFDIPAGTAVVQDGWKQFATVTLETHHGYAYRALWRSVVDLLIWFAVAALVSAALAWWIVRAIQRPLQTVVAQARDIGQRRFTTTEVPRTRELREVVLAMNQLSNVVRLMLAEETRKLDKLRRRLQQDEVTGVAKRDALMHRLDAMLTSDGQRSAGHLAMVRVANLTVLNERLGYAATNQFLNDLAGFLRELAENYDEGFVGRLNGTDFGLILPGCSDPDALIEAIKSQLYTQPDVERSGIELPVSLVAYAQGDKRGELLSVLDGALSKAETRGGKAIEVATTDAKRQPYRTHDEWRQALTQALSTDGVYLAHYPVLDSDGQLLHHECPARLKLKDAWQSAGVFLPWASRIGMSRDIDLAVVDTALRTIAQDDKPLGINLSSESIRDTGFVAALRQRLQDKPQEARQLWIEVPESAAVRHMAAFRTLSQELRQFGCKMGIEHVGPEFAKLNSLHDLGLTYLKIDASLIQDINREDQTHPFLRGIATLSHSIGVLVIGEGVANQEERETLFDLGFDGVTGPGVRLTDNR
ncbi:EAL domain-containing protein [Halomonas sp. McH1-25]|uniref:bifunctional diguanylate cyclase/phosphodiesterase n=1 Tax=unclassified Halomonas TaxID=2609666 RepID=UPI001EF547B4|nr:MULTISPECIES: EAL domain-containing protein [unclassified Halomonas]MCG7598932.1 EAL domain-containing protein [Halomonas sp. McH1-25]MCP1344182.1 EAL domain-containing protein [Halomonas sp. FL8]MCP1363025.1 EAL domain-containing protein [Halomonas sp. BBD45]MCP1363823.1 EAL domain-containing protein [Halomonas sp. BBD48]